MKVTIKANSIGQTNIVDVNGGVIVINPTPHIDIDRPSTIRDTPLGVLRSVLARLYSDEASSRRIVADSGLSDSKIDFSGSAENRWCKILDECKHQQMINTLIKVVRSKGEYENNDELKKACQEYLDSQQK